MTSVSGRSIPWCGALLQTDIAEALGQGLRDFQAAPLYGLAFGALLSRRRHRDPAPVWTAFGMIYLAYPLAAGFALLGPFVAIGLYEAEPPARAGRSFEARLSGPPCVASIGWNGPCVTLSSLRDLDVSGAAVDRGC